MERRYYVKEEEEMSKSKETIGNENEKITVYTLKEKRIIPGFCDAKITGDNIIEQCKSHDIKIYIIDERKRNIIKYLSTKTVVNWGYIQFLPFRLCQFDISSNGLIIPKTEHNDIIDLYKREVDYISLVNRKLKKVGFITAPPVGDYIYNYRDPQGNGLREEALNLIRNHKEDFKFKKHSNNWEIKYYNLEDLNSRGEKCGINLGVLWNDPEGLYKPLGEYSLFALIPIANKEGNLYLGKQIKYYSYI